MFDAAKLRPMLATLPASDPSLADPNLVYEPKYDGIRAIVLVEPGSARARVQMWSRLGNEKTRQFPEVVEVLEHWGRTLPGPVVLDGEIVALDAESRPAGFQRLQNRIHVKTPTYRSSKPQPSREEQPTAFIAFDLLRHQEEDLRSRPLIERRRALEALFEQFPRDDRQLRMSEQVAGDGHQLYERAKSEGWEGLLVKHARSPYRDGRRSPEWQKMKILQQDEFMVGGWTEPKGTRARFGSLVLGAWRGDTLVHVGEVGTGFNGAELERLWTVLQPLATEVSPFATKPRTMGRPHWVKPKLVAQVRFSEWTDEERLRHPTYLGLRDDKRPSQVTSAPRPVPDRTQEKDKARAKSGNKAAFAGWQAEAARLTEQLDDFESRRKNGRLQLPDGDTLEITNPHKVFWPEPAYTKGDLLRFYARVAPLILPVVDERPLVMKRLPNGVHGEAFYQHRAPEPVPSGVRVATLPDDDVPARLIGGELKTLLYMTQIASISMDPWFSRLPALDHPDQVAIDLDPQPGATFAQILDVARWVFDELDRLGVTGYPKTSGSEGLHIFIPLEDQTSYEAGMLFCQIVATLVASKHPKVATVERAVRKRKNGTVYVDYLQNIQGKTLACAYSARASAFAGVSAPLTWDEVFGDPKPQDFTIASMPDRLAAVGDLWEATRTSKGADLERAIEKLQP
ncbi:MAG: DNA ligase D [Acidobacteria bacterium]|nr:DNA ligase D [Acidobacteriota bacterium]